MMRNSYETSAAPCMRALPRIGTDGRSTTNQCDRATAISIMSGGDPSLQDRRLQEQRQNFCLLLSACLFLLFAGLLFPYALRPVDEEPSAQMLTMICIFSFLVAILFTTTVMCRRHVNLRRDAGYENACFDCFDLREPADPWNPQSLAHLRSVASLPDATSMRVELRVLTALAEIPVREWKGVDGEDPLECSLCMAEVEDGGHIRELRCGHAFHVKCIGASRSAGTRTRP